MAEFPVTKPEFIVPSCVNLSTYIQGMSDYEVRCYYSQLVQQWATEWAQVQKDWENEQQAFESFKQYVNSKLSGFQDWFDNLDVQQEINNKLDQMATSGELTNLLHPIADEIFSTANTALETANAANNRISEIVADGQKTEGNSELMDIRVGYDGQSYKTAGDAVRAQTRLNNNLLNPTTPTGKIYPVYTSNEPTNLIKYNFLRPDMYIDASGNIHTGSGFHLTNYIDISGMQSLVSQNVGLSAFYDAAFTFISSTSSPNGASVPSNAKYILCSIPDAAIEVAVLNDHVVNTNDHGYKNIDTFFNVKDNTNDIIRFTVPVNSYVYPENDWRDTVTELETITNVNCYLALPDSYDRFGNPTPLIVICHGAGKGISPTLPTNQQWLESEDYMRIVNGLKSNGYAVMDCNGYDNTIQGADFWGAPSGVSAWTKAIQYVMNNYNVSKYFGIYGFSMGGCTALNLLAQGIPGCVVCALGSPVINLEACFTESSGTRSDMNSAYGEGDGNYTFTTRMKVQSPYAKIVGDTTKYAFTYYPPMRIYFGGNEVDQSGVNKEYAKELAAAMTSAGAYVQYREVANRGHEICYGADNSVIVDFILFFNRYLVK